jgi:hypothetical protein
MLKKDIVPEIYLDRGYTTQFVGYEKKEKTPKMKKKPKDITDYKRFINDL